MTILEIFELAKIKVEQEQKDLGIANIMMLENIKTGAEISIPNQKVRRSANRELKKLFEKYHKMANPKKTELIEITDDDFFGRSKKSE